MKIILNPSYISFTDLTSDEIFSLNKQFSIRADRYYFSKLYQRKIWDGYIHFFSEKRRLLPIGFLNKVLENYQVSSIIDLRNRNVIYDYDFKFKIKPRDYQLDNILRSLVLKSGIINLAMSAGKTLIFIILAMILKKNGVLIITHRKDIYDEIIKKFKDYVGDIEIGEINSETINPVSTITLAMVQTLNNHLDELKNWFSKINVIIADEAQHVLSTVYQQIFKKSNAYIRFGTSGTIPDKNTVEWMKTIQFIGDVIIKITSKELINMGITAKPVIHIIDVKSLPIKNYKESLFSNVIFNIDKTIKIISLVEKNEKKKILIITDYINHGRIISRILTDLKYKNEFLYSAIKDRKEKLAKFASGRIPLIISTNILDEGVDIVDINVIILAFPRKSYRQVLQRIGRGLRKTEGKETVDIYDFYDSNDRYLRSHYNKRISYYKAEGFEYRHEEVMIDDKKSARWLEVVQRENMFELQNRARDIRPNSRGNTEDSGRRETTEKREKSEEISKK